MVMDMVMDLMVKGWALQTQTNGFSNMLEACGNSKMLARRKH